MAWSKVSRHERGYGTAHVKMRAHLLATVITCEGECKRRGIETLGHVADHVIPLADGGTGERSNYQLLCQDCSDAKTLADKGMTARPVGGVDRSGRPTSPSHPWNWPKRT